MSYEKDYEDWEESIFFNKFALFWLIALVLAWALSLYLIYWNWKTDIMSYRNLQASWNIKEVTKSEFIEKINTKWLWDIVKALEQNSKGTVRLCEDSFCKWVLWKISISFVPNIKLEKEVFQEQMIKYFNISEAQFESQYKNLNWDSFLLRDRFFDSNFYKPLFLEDDNSYYLVLAEQFEQKEQLLARKSEFIKTIAESVKSLWMISSLESKQKTDLFVETSDDLIKAYNYSLLYEFPKDSIKNEKNFLLIYWPNEFQVETLKEKKLNDLLQDTNIKFDKLNIQLNNLLLRESIIQLFEKSSILVKDLMKVREEQEAKLKVEKTEQSVTNKDGNVKKDTSIEAPEVQKANVNSLTN